MLATTLSVVRSSWCNLYVCCFARSVWKDLLGLEGYGLRWLAKSLQCDSNDMEHYYGAAISTFANRLGFSDHAIQALNPTCNSGCLDLGGEKHVERHLSRRSCLVVALSQQCARGKRGEVQGIEHIDGIYHVPEPASHPPDISRLALKVLLIVFCSVVLGLRWNA